MLVKLHGLSERSRQEATLSICSFEGTRLSPGEITRGEGTPVFCVGVGWTVQSTHLVVMPTCISSEFGSAIFSLDTVALSGHSAGAPSSNTLGAL